MPDKSKKKKKSQEPVDPELFYAQPDKKTKKSKKLDKKEEPVYPEFLYAQPEKKKKKSKKSDKKEEVIDPEFLYAQPEKKNKKQKKSASSTNGKPSADKGVEDCAPPVPPQSVDMFTAAY